MNDEEMLTRGLKALAAEMDQVEAPPEVELKVLDAFRARQVVRPITSRRSTSRYWVAAAIAAMLLITISVIAYRMNRGVDGDRQFARQEQPQSTPKVKDQPVREEQAGVEEQKVVAQVPQVPKPRHVRHASARRPENTELANHAEIATDFIPLSYMTPANLQDGGQIVRVELPRSALAKFGLPVNMDRNEKVKADVLFGVDGMAHAIRFIQ